jgi:hypothetical protein
MAHRRRRGTGLLAAVVVLGVGSPLGGGCEEACAAPYRPVGHQYTYPGGPPAGDWPVTGEARPRPSTVLDTDGDGAADTAEIDEDQRQVTIHRTAGDLVVTVPAPQVVVSGPGISLGDPDGDGRTDTLIEVVADLSSSTVTRYVLPGATPDGTHDLAAVAVAVPAAASLQGVGDVDGDGRDDVAAAGPVEAQVWLGPDLDLGVGAPPSPPSHVVPGMLRNAVHLDVASGRTALNLQAIDPMDIYLHIETTLWVPQGSLRFTTQDSGVGPQSPLGLADIVDGDGTTWLVVYTTGRGGRSEWAWDLADLCAGGGAGGAGPAELLALAGG